MRVVHASHGRFHHHDLARQLEARGLLERFFTGYPKWKLKGQGLPLDKVTTFPWFEAPYMALIKTRAMRGGLERRAFRMLMKTFDNHVANKMPPCDAFIGLSCASLKSGREVQKYGGLYICDRGSAHIASQDEILREEFARQGQAYQGIDPWIVDRELTEYEQADLITVPSEFARRTFVEQGVPEAKVVKVTYGVDVEHFHKTAEPQDGYFDIVFVGHASFRKGIPDLLEAFRRLQHPRKRLAIIGSVSGEIRAGLARRPGLENVTFVGHVQQTNLKGILSRSHVMVLPSVEEGLALVMAQGLACGCPVIATENTGASDLFEHEKQGFIVPIRDPATIAAALQRLADDPAERMAMSAAAETLAHHRLRGWDSYGDAMVSVLVQHLAVGGATGPWQPTF